MLTGFETSRRDDAIALLASFAHKPYDGNEQEWGNFLLQTLGLELCYLDGVKKAIADGRWRAKADPIAYVRKVGQTGALNLYGVTALKDRGLAYVGRVNHGALDPEQRYGAKNSREYDLRFDRPQSQGLASAGPVSGIAVAPGRRYSDGYSKAFSYEEKLDYLIFMGGESDYERRQIASRVPERLLLNPDFQDEDEDPRVNWEAVATEAKLDMTEREVVVKYWSRGISRERAFALQTTDSKRRFLQSAWKRMDRNQKWATISKLLRGNADSTATNRHAERRQLVNSGVSSTGPSRYDSAGLVIW